MGTFEVSLQSPAGPGAERRTSFEGLTPGATRLIACAGLLSFVLIVVGAFVAAPLWDAPGTNASAVRVASYLQANHVRTIASLYIYSIGIGLFLCFAGGLAAWLREHERPPRALSTVFACGAVGLVVLILAAFASAGVMSYRPQQPAFAATLSDTTFGLLALSGIPTAVCLGAYGLLVHRHRLLPLWTGWLAWIAVDAHLLIAASFMSHGSFLSLEGTVIVAVPATFFAWILATSVALWRAGARAHAAGPAWAAVDQR